jgi:hypothetical protein
MHTRSSAIQARLCLVVALTTIAGGCATSPQQPSPAAEPKVASRLASPADDSNSIPYGGTNVVAIGTGSAGKLDKSDKDKKAGYTFRFYYCDGRTDMNPPAETIKAYTASGNWVCLFYEGGGYPSGTRRSERSGQQCRTRALTGGYAGGQTDAAIAYPQAASLGMPLGRPIFFTVDTDPGRIGSARMKKIIEYLKGAADWAHTNGYTVGCYGGSYLLKTLFDQKVIDFGEETTAWCHHFHETRSQIRQEGPGPYAAYAEDYGQWRWQEAPRPLK